MRALEYDGPVLVLECRECGWVERRDRLAEAAASTARQPVSATDGKQERP